MHILSPAGSGCIVSSLCQKVTLIVLCGSRCDIHTVSTSGLRLDPSSSFHLKFRKPDGSLQVQYQQLAGGPHGTPGSLN